MRWLDRVAPLNRQAVERAIHPEKSLRAAKDSSGACVWLRVRTRRGKIVSCKKEGDCSPADVERFKDLGRGEIVWKMKVVNGWAVACIK